MMTQGIYTKWIMGGIALLIMIAVACFFWYRHDTAYERQQAAKSTEVGRQWEASQKVDNKIEAEQAADVVSVESNRPTTEEQKTDTKPVTQITEPTKAQAEKKTTETADVPVSPFGFGPYPKLPADYPGAEDPKFWTYDWNKNDELMIRVSVKLWEQGKQTHGTTMENGLVYPTYPNTLIVEWKTQWTPSGTRRYASSIQGSPETESWLDSHPGTIYEGDIPSHFTVIEYKDAGIDPYKFLDLP